MRYYVKPAANSDFYIFDKRTECAIARVFNRELADEICGALNERAKRASPLLACGRSLRRS